MRSRPQFLAQIQVYGHRPRREWALVAGLLLASFLMRLALFPIPGYKVDQGDFWAWYRFAVERGLANFYAPPNWSDYPPLNVYLFWAFGHLARLVGWWALPFLIKLPQNLFDLGTAALLFLWLRRRFRFKIALALTAAYAFNPATIYNAAVWGQMDAVYTLFLVASLMALTGRRFELCGALLTLGVLTKPLALVPLPVLAYVLLREGGWRRALITAAVSGALVLLVLLPFSWENPVLFLWEQYFGGYNVYAYNSINAYNLWALMGFWKPDTTILLGLSFRWWGVVAFLLLVAAVIWQLHRRFSIEAILFASFLLMFGFFMLMTRMHERYLFPALPLLALAFSLRPALWLYVGLTATHFTNLAYVLPVLNADGFIPDGDWSFFILVPANAALLAYALWSFWRWPHPGPATRRLLETVIDTR